MSELKKYEVWRTLLRVLDSRDPADRDIETVSNKLSAVMTRCFEDFNFSFNKATLKKVLAKKVTRLDLRAVVDWDSCGACHCVPSRIEQAHDQTDMLNSFGLSTRIKSALHGRSLDSAAMQPACMPHVCLCTTDSASTCSLHACYSAPHGLTHPLPLHICRLVAGPWALGSSNSPAGAAGGVEVTRSRDRTTELSSADQCPTQERR